MELAAKLEVQNTIEAMDEQIESSKTHTAASTLRSVTQGGVSLASHAYSAIQMREEALANHLPANLTHNDTAQKITHQASAIASNLYEVRVRAIV